MFPRKAVDEIAEYAKGKDIPASDISDIINGYYREVKTHCSNLEYPIMDIRGLGYLKVRHTKIVEGIRKLTKELKDVLYRDKDSYYWKKWANLKMMKEMKVKVEDEWKREKEKKEEKKQYKNRKHGLERDTQTGME